LLDARASRDSAQHFPVVMGEDYRGAVERVMNFLLGAVTGCYRLVASLAVTHLVGCPCRISTKTSILLIS
jgi:hypothetical protein